MLNKLTGGGPKKARGGDETYAADLGVFNEMHDRVKAIDVALATYEKKVAAVAPALRVISQAFTGLYTDPSYADHATSFDSSYQTVNGAIAAFQTQQAETRKVLADYLVRLKALSKAIDQHDALYSDMINKEKAAQKAKPKEQAVSQEKAAAAKDAYTVKHQEVSRDLHELVENKYKDLELVFQAVVTSQQKLFSQMSNSFEGHGVYKKSGSSAIPSNTPRAAPGLPPASAPPPAAYNATPPPIPSQTTPPPVPVASYNAPPVPAASYSAPPVPGAYGAPPPATPSYGAPPVPASTSAPPPVPASSYGAPPVPAASYGAPPVPAADPYASSHGAPPVPAADPYGLPPPLPSSTGAPPPLPVNTGAPPPVPAPSGGSRKQKLSVVSAIEREKFEALFQREEAKEGKGTLSGEFVFEMFSRSGLSNDDLGQIWELSDQDTDGCLDQEEFVLAMYLINAKLRNQIPSIPSTLPPEYVIHPL